MKNRLCFQLCELAAHGEASLVPENDFGGWVAGCLDLVPSQQGGLLGESHQGQEQFSERSIR